MFEFGRLRWLFVLITLFLFQLPTIGQNKKALIVTGKIVPEVSTSENGAIELSKSGAAPTRIDIPRNGRFKLELEYFNEFTLVFSLPGHFSKTILVSTEIPQAVWERDNDFPSFPMIVQLFREIEGIDKSFTLKPSGRIFYGKQTDNFEKESIFNDSEIAEQITNATAQAGQVKKEAQGITKQESQEFAAKEKNFDQAVNEADVLYRRGEFQPALLKYREANKLFPEKVYPNDRIAELQDLVKAMEITERQKAELEQKYQEAIAQANKLFDQKTYLQARPGYEEALKYKAGDAYANGRIVEIDQLLAVEAKQKQFDEMVAQADNHFKSKNLDQAAALYAQAKLIVPENEYPQNQLDLINEEKQKLAQLEVLETEFSRTIENGDKLSQQKEYLQALNAYRSALELKPNNQLATDKISATEQQIAILEKEQQGKALEEQYQLVIARADKSFDSQNYDDARSIYSEALAIKSNEAHPTQRIARIDEILAENSRLQQLDIEFLALVEKGDGALTQKDYEVARGNYSNALVIKPNSTEIKNKIKNIDTILQKLAADKKKEEDRLLALAASTDKAYTDAMTKGNQQMEQKTFANAKLTFLEAKKLKPAEPLPDEMIARIDSMVESNERALAEERLKEEAYQKSILETQAQSFLEAMNTADKAFSENDFTTAKLGYQTALAIKKDDPDAQKKLGLTEAKMAEMGKLTLAYNAAINMANKQVENKLYLEAKENYQEALQYLPDSDYPKRQIERLNELLSQVEAEGQKEELYAAKIKEGESLLGNKDYVVARSTFVQASELKPSEGLPLQRISEIDKILSDLALENAKIKTLESTYQEAITRADQKFDAKEYRAAQLVYGEALAIQPNEAYPKNRVAEIEKLLSDLKIQQYNQAIAAGELAFKSDQLEEATTQYELALTFNNNDSFATQQLNEIDKRRVVLLTQKEELKKLEDQYKSFMDVASIDFIGKDYQEAKVKYQKASSLKPTEALPKELIAQIDVLSGELATAEETDRLYEESIKSGQLAFEQNKLIEARDAYQKANNLKSNEPTPPIRIAELNQQIADQEQSEKQKALQEAQQLAKEKADRELYEKAIGLADKSFADKQYLISRVDYSNALNILPEEKYPQDQLTIIDQLIAQKESTNPQGLGAKQQAMNDSIMPLNVIAADPVFIAKESHQATASRANSVETVSNYDEVIHKADDAFGIKDYAVARFYYYKASETKPSEEYPRTQIDLIRKLVDTELSSVVRSDYQEAIDMADDAFQKSNYTVSKFYYYKALGIKSWEKYPKDRVQEILVLTNSLLSEKEEQQYRDLIARGDEAYTVKDFAIARFYYNKAISMKKNEDYPWIKIKDLEKIIAQDQQELRNLEYNQLIELADQALQDENYSIARFNYNKALGMRPKEQYPKDQLKRIKEALE